MPGEADQVHHREEEVAQLFLHRVGVVRPQGGGDLLQLLGDLLHRAPVIRPVEADGGHPLLDPERLVQGVQPHG